MLTTHPVLYVMRLDNLKFHNYNLHVKVKVNINLCLKWLESGLATRQHFQHLHLICAHYGFYSFSLYRLALRNVHHVDSALQPELLPWLISLGVCIQ